jgi:hypothetical protein
VPSGHRNLRINPAASSRERNQLAGDVRRCRPKISKSEAVDSLEGVSVPDRETDWTEPVHGSGASRSERMQGRAGLPLALNASEPTWGFLCAFRLGDTVRLPWGAGCDS